MRTTTEIVKDWLALPPEALPQCYGDDPSDEPQNVRLAVELLGRGNVAAGVVFSENITLAADRPEWRDGMTISVREVER